MADSQKLKYLQITTPVAISFDWSVS